MNSLFDIARVPFSYHGSWMSLSIPAGQNELFFRNHHFKPNNLFAVRVIDSGSGRVIMPTITAQPAALTLTAGGGRVEICFAGPDSVRLRGRGLALQFAGERIHAYNNGPNLAVFNFRRAYRRYQFEALGGTLDLRGAYAAEEEDLNNLAELHGDTVFNASDENSRNQQILYVTPDDNGEWEIAVDEFWSSWQRPERKAFDACLEASAKAFNVFRKKMPHSPEGLEEAQQLAAYINWSCTVNPSGLVKRPTLFMSKNWMNNVWSWDQCFNAMALAGGEPQLAMDQMLTLVDHQDRFGAFPDAFNDMEIHYNFSKPPVHGWTFSELLKRLPERPSAGIMQTMYTALGRQADWWMTHRVLAAQTPQPPRSPKSREDQASANPSAAGVRRLPYYLHGNDSGWDNSTMFAKGVPLAAPDLAALLTVQMDVLANLATDLGKEDEAVKWQARADALFTDLMDILWVGDHFVACRANDGAAVESQSLIPRLTIILGQRLPCHIRALLKTGIEGHLTAWGLATEKTASPDYLEDGYWRGPIWAPSTFLAVSGLDRAGYGDLADTIAERFCRLCRKSGMAENFNALTGEALRDPAYTWTSSVFLLLAERLGKRQQNCTSLQ